MGKVREKSGGRQKGTPNKATTAAREALAVFMDGNIHRLQDWLENIEHNDGAQAAFRAYASLLEFHVPKRQRVEAVVVDSAKAEVQYFSWAGCSRCEVHRDDLPLTVVGSVNDLDKARG